MIAHLRQRLSDTAMQTGMHSTECCIPIATFDEVPRGATLPRICLVVHIERIFYLKSGRTGGMWMSLKGWVEKEWALESWSLGRRVEGQVQGRMISKVKCHFPSSWTLWPMRIGHVLLCSSILNSHSLLSARSLEFINLAQPKFPKTSNHNHTTSHFCLTLLLPPCTFTVSS